MRFNRKLTAGLAWGGLFLVFAVPSAEIVSSQLAPRALNVTPSGVAPLVAPASAPIPATRVASTRAEDALDQYLATGKPLPSYISDAPDAVTVAPAATQVAAKPLAVTLPTAPAADPTSVQTAAIPPKPMPAHMRPLPPFEPQPTTPTEAVVIVDESSVLADVPPVQEAALPSRSQPRPPAVLEDDQPRVTEEDLADWDSGSLADFLERRGLIDDDSSEESAVADDFDEDGFFLDDGPNSERRSRARRIRESDGDFIVFPRFN